MEEGTPKRLARVPCWFTVQKTALLIIAVTVTNSGLLVSSAPSELDRIDDFPVPVLYKGPGIALKDRGTIGAKVAKDIQEKMFELSPDANRLQAEKDADTVAVEMLPNGHDLNIAFNVKDRAVNQDGKMVYTGFGYNNNLHNKAITSVLSKDPKFDKSLVRILAPPEPPAFETAVRAQEALRVAEKNLAAATEGNNREKIKVANRALNNIKPLVKPSMHEAVVLNAQNHAEMVHLSPNNQYAPPTARDSEGNFPPERVISVSKLVCEHCTTQLREQGVKFQHAGTSDTFKTVQSWLPPQEIDVVSKTEFKVHSPTGHGKAFIPELNASPDSNPQSKNSGGGGSGGESSNTKKPISVKEPASVVFTPTHARRDQKKGAEDVEGEPEIRRSNAATLLKEIKAQNGCP